MHMLHGGLIMAKKEAKKLDKIVEEAKEEGIKAEVVSDKDYEVRREPSGKLVHVYKDGRVLPAH